MVGAWSKQNKQVVMQMFEGGASMSEIGAHFGVSRNCISGIISRMRKNGEFAMPASQAWANASKRRKAEIKQRLAELLSDGVELEMACARMRVPWPVVCAAFRAIRDDLGRQAV